MRAYPRGRDRARTRDLESAWAAFLAGAMEQGSIPDGERERHRMRGIHGMMGDALIPIAAGLFTVADGLPRLIGSQCGRCGTVAFPRQPSCPKCTSVEVSERLLARRGKLWSWTIQCFPPKSPPYAVDDPDSFEPYGVGYIELPGEVRVEARLTEADPARLRIGMPMELTLVPAPGGEARGAATYAFRPITKKPYPQEPDREEQDER